MDSLKKNKKEYLIKGVLLLVVLLSVYLGVWEKFEKDFYDTSFRVRGEKSTGNDIIIIAMDEKSISKLGSLPWNRSNHAELLSRLKSARVVGFDILFDTDSETIHDQKFASAISRAGNVILASMFSFEKHNDGHWYQELVKPIPELSSAAKGTGFINMPSDKNIVRNTMLFDTNTYRIPYPSFNLAIFNIAKGKETDDIIIEDDKLILYNDSINITSKNQAIIDFWGPGRSFPTYSYIDVLNGNIPEDIFQDKIILVGIATPTAKSDYYDNPYTSENLILKGTLPVPGVEIHASAIKTYLEGNSYKRLPAVFNYIILIIVFIIANYIDNKRNSLKSYPLTIMFVLSIPGVSYLLWYHQYLIINTVAPMGMVIVVFAFNTTQNLLRSEIERRNTRNMFSRYVSSEVVDEILSKDSININKSSNRDVTIMFVDLRNFTSFSENRPPEEVVKRLNYYFKEMTKIIFRHGGTLDKYIGDAIMAIFGAPIQSEDHAKQAVQASVEIMQKAEEMSELLISNGEPPLKIGIGINTGNVIAGSIGSEIRMEYTVIGDAVNLASRFETHSKKYPNGIILGKNTIKELDDFTIPNWKINSLGFNTIKGISKETEIFIIKEIDKES